MIKQPTNSLSHKITQYKNQILLTEIKLYKISEKNQFELNTTAKLRWYFLYKEIDIKKCFAKHKDLFLVILSILVIILNLIILGDKFEF